MKRIALTAGIAGIALMLVAELAILGFEIFHLSSDELNALKYLLLFSGFATLFPALLTGSALVISGKSPEAGGMIEMLLGLGGAVLWLPSTITLFVIPFRPFYAVTYGLALFVAAVLVMVSGELFSRLARGERLMGA